MVEKLFFNISLVLIFFLMRTCFASGIPNRYFIKNQISFGFYEKHVLPRFTPHPPSPIFWRSRARVDYGATVFYERNVFHTKKYFSINGGASLSAWSLQSQVQLAVSGFFVFRVWLFRTKTFNPFIAWSIAGPTILSSNHFSNYKLGSRFTFQDFLGLGAVVGKKQAVVVSLKLYHYSNGDMFLRNDGFNVPLVVCIGFTFN